jgi:hypothetical protein
VRGIAHWPSAIFSLPHASSTFLKLDFRGGCLSLPNLFTFCSWTCSNVGTLMVCEQGGFIEEGKIPRRDRFVATQQRSYRCAHRYINGHKLYRSIAGAAAGARTS